MQILTVHTGLHPGWGKKRKAQLFKLVVTGSQQKSLSNSTFDVSMEENKKDV